MSRKFSDFTSKNLSEFAAENESVINAFKQQNSQDYDNINSLLNKYNNMSQDQLFNEFLRVAQQKKQDGTLSLEYISNIRNTIFPMLSFDQQKVFDDLVRYIR